MPMLRKLSVFWGLSVCVGGKVRGADSGWQDKNKLMVELINIKLNMLTVLTVECVIMLTMLS